MDIVKTLYDTSNQLYVLPDGSCPLGMLYNIATKDNYIPDRALQLVALACYLNPSKHTICALNRHKHEILAVITRHMTLSQTAPIEHDFFVKRLPQLVKEYERPPVYLWSIWYKQWCINLWLWTEQRVYKQYGQHRSDSEYGDGWISPPISQVIEPIVNAGVCQGFAMLLIAAILSDDKMILNIIMHAGSDSDARRQERIFFPLSKVDRMLFYLEQVNAMCYMTEQCQHANILYFTEQNVSLSWLTAYAASAKIARTVVNIISQIPTNAQYGFGLHLDARTMDGHTIGIAVTTTVLYFIDANIGVFRFNRNKDALQQFGKFIQTILYALGYSHMFNQFSCTNYPPLEQFYQKPSSLQQVKQYTQPAQCSLLQKVLWTPIDLGNTALTAAFLARKLLTAQASSMAKSVYQRVCPSLKHRTA